MANTQINTEENVLDIAEAVAENAALAYANAKTEDAFQILIDHLNDTKGDTKKIIWYLLLDLYQIQKKRTQFEKTAEMFARRFGASPPSWSDELNNRNQYFSGRNVIIFDGALEADMREKIEDFLKISRELKQCRLDCSRVDLQQSSNDGLKIWHHTMEQVRESSIKATLMGDIGIVEQLKELIKKDDIDDERKRLYWLVLLELLQWEGSEEDFEELGFEYALYYDISPPGWDMNGIMKTEDSDFDSTGQKISKPEVPDEITESTMQTLLENIKLWLQQQPEDVIYEANFQFVTRITFEAAGYFNEWLNKNPELTSRIVVKHPNHWVLVLFFMTNLLDKITIEYKKTV